MLDDRLVNSSRQFWRLSASLLAVATTSIVAIAVGALVANDGRPAVRLLAAVLIANLAVSTIVSVQGISSGTLLTVAPLGPFEVASSFLIVGSQVGAALLVAHVATAPRTDDVETLRHFLLLHAGLALGAVLANRIAARGRRTWADVVRWKLEPAHGVPEEFEATQLEGARGAGIGTAVMTGAWLVSLSWPAAWFVGLAAGLEGAAMTIQLKRHRAVDARLWERQLAVGSRGDH